MKIMKEITVVAAIWQDAEGRFFVAQRAEGRSQAGLWEFPGGKVEANEDEKEALARELQEEFDVIAIIGDFCMETLYNYETGKQLRLRAYFVQSVVGMPVLKEHQAMLWVKAEMLLQLALSPADIPIARTLSTKD
jgi:mutator protein MutT